ncbi:MAG TPA: ECF-type sigma factor [Planctomycetota bacterium]|nr:ECF-type sigma factor [Planctomycetota bacterium]
MTEPRDEQPQRPPELSLLLQAAGEGRVSQAELFPVVYAQLRELARQQMGAERTGHSLQPTALVHEAWLRLGGNDAVTWQGRAHFFGSAAEAMRRILVDHARGRNAQKREGGFARLPLDAVELAAADDPWQVLALDEALGRLEAHDERLAKVVRLRFWAGLGEREVAELLQVSERTVRNDWKLARAWLARELQG